MICGYGGHGNRELCLCHAMVFRASTFPPTPIPAGLVRVGYHSARRARFDLAIAHPYLKAGLAISGRPDNDAAVLDRKFRLMPGAGDRLAVKFSFRKRSAEVRALFCHDEDLMAALDHEHWNAVRVRFAHLAFAKFRFFQQAGRICSATLPARG